MSNMNSSMKLKASIITLISLVFTLIPTRINATMGHRTIEIFDPHFHSWDLNSIQDIKNTNNLETSEISVSGHDHALFGTHHYPGKIYDINTYLSDWEDLQKLPDFKLVGGCIMEAASVCFPNSESDSELVISALIMKYEFFKKQSEKINKKQSNHANFGVPRSHLSKKLKFYLSPAVLLESESFIGPHLKSLSQNQNVKSVRQILNQGPAWPRQSENH